MALATIIIGPIALVPVIGVFFGALAIILGIITLSTFNPETSRGKPLAITGLVLGVCGVILSVGIMVFSFKMMNTMLNSDDPKMAKIRQEMNSVFVTQTVGSLEAYKSKYGNYPDTLVTDTASGFSMLATDFKGNHAFYKRIPENDSYELRYPGADGTLFTDDDVIHNSPSCNSTVEEESEEQVP